MSDLPTLISFYTSEPYYTKAAARLRSDCERVGMPHDVEEIATPEGDDWTEVCRLKIPFYLRKLREHDGAVLWVDADCRLLQIPHQLRGCQFDIAGYPRGFRSVREYDPYETVRFWVPGIIFFNNTSAGVRFLERMQEIDTSTARRVTDDFVLEETWRRFEVPLSVGLLAPNTVARRRGTETDDAVFLYGHSGRVGAFRDTVDQHDPRDLMGNPRVSARIAQLVDSPTLRSKIVRTMAREALHDGNRIAARRLLESAVEFDPTDFVSAKTYARVLRRDRELEAAYAAVTPFIEDAAHAGPALQALVELALGSRDLVGARRYVDQLTARPEPEWHDIGRSLQFEVSLEERAEAQGLSAKERPALWWMRGPRPGNFGDALSPYIVEKVGGKPPRTGKRGKGLLAIGSVIKFATAESDVWGTGSPRTTDKLSADARYHAVRGPITRELVLRDGGTCPDVYGDPALLLPRFYTPRTSAKRFGLGIINHVQHVREAALDDGVREISLRRIGYSDIEDTIDEILECEAIMSTSLHGLIVAHAYGIPARWCEYSAQPAAVAGDGTKFQDYFRSVGIPEQSPFDLSEHSVISADFARHVNPSVDLEFSADRLIDAFPA